MKVNSQLERAQLENLTADPSGADLVDGRIWLNTTTGLVKEVIAGVVKVIATADNTLTFTNKSISGATNTITAVPGANVTNTPSGNLAATDVQAALNELQSDIDTRATSAALGAHTGATTSVHGIADTADLLTTNNAKVVTEKDIDGGTASNARRITIPKDTLANLQALTRKAGTIVFATDTGKQYIDNGTNLVPVGTGSGGKNYLPDGDAEGANPFVMYNDGASATPVNGTGGSPTSTITQSATSPLSDQKSFLFNSGGIGDGGAYAFTIDSVDVSSMQTLIFRTDGAIAAGDLSVWLYDVTNSVLIAPQPTQFVSNTFGNQQFIFQLGAGTSYRFLIHQASANSFTAKFEVSLSAMPFAGYSTIKTDWEAVTPTFAEFGTVSAISIYKAQDGKDLLLRGNFTTGTTGGSTPYIAMPSGLKIDTARLPSGVISIIGELSRGIGAAGAGIYKMYMVYDGSDNTKIYFTAPNNGGNPFTIATVASSFFASSEIQYITYARIPIQGWSSQSQVVSEYDGRVVSSNYYEDVATQSVTAFNQINFETKSYDYQNAVTIGSGWKYTAKNNGLFDYDFSVICSVPNAGFFLYKNGVSFAPIIIANSYGYASVSGSIELLANDYIDIRPDTSVTIYGRLHGTPSNTSLIITMRSGSQQIISGIGTNPAIISAVYTSGTAGGSVSNAAYQAAPVNTIVSDTSAIIQNTSAFTGTGGTNTDFQLAPGTYYIRATFTLYTANSYAKCRLYNSTDSSVVTIGQSKYDNNGTCTIIASTVVTITSTKTFQAQARTNNVATFGEPASLGDAETYTVIEIKKM